MIKFNGRTTIPEYIEECSYGTWSSSAISVDVRRTADDVLISQDKDAIRLTGEQAKQLKDFLNQHLE